VTDVRLGREEGQPQQLVRIDRARAADLGVSVAQVARTLETALGGGSAGEFRDRGTETRIWVQLENAERLSLEDILRLTLPGRDGEAVALRNLVRFETDVGPIRIQRKEQQRMTTVSANIAGTGPGLGGGRCPRWDRPTFRCPATWRSPSPATSRSSSGPSRS
jgi:hydrophobic/amphiphilic exporter-1 (mainly G- bacteria), HAE1 family